MKYYLAIKLLRNHINHASEQDIKPDEMEVVTYLKKEGIDVNLNYYNVVKLLKEANAINLPDKK